MSDLFLVVFSDNVIIGCHKACVVVDSCVIGLILKMGLDLNYRFADHVY